MKQIAIYGKGGIGKSTIAANLSAVLGLAGLNVLQVGCDPKQDSTRLLLEGRTVRTALDYLRDMPPPGRQLQEIVHVGFAGVSCVEAGGPEPGIGCAGRGILSTFELLEQLGITAFHYDLAVYDVLGDVVCGGFAVPLRYEYADAIYIVTSGEFMALYAGNNILRGVRNYEGRGPRMGGILFNQRGLEGEEQRVRRFAAAVGLPIVAAFPRSHLFHAAERCGRTIAQVFPESDLVDLFRALAAYVSNSPPCLPAQPLSPEAFEDLLLESRPRTTGKRGFSRLWLFGTVIASAHDREAVSEVANGGGCSPDSPGSPGSPGRPAPALLLEERASPRSPARLCFQWGDAYGDADPGQRGRRSWAAKLCLSIEPGTGVFGAAVERAPWGGGAPWFRTIPVLLGHGRTDGHLRRECQPGGSPSLRHAGPSGSAGGRHNLCRGHHR